MSISIADIKQKDKLRNEENINSTTNVTSTRKVSMTYQFIPSINFSLTRTHKADADIAGIKSSKELIQSILDSLYFGRETDISQSFKMDYRPKWFTWFTPDYSYTSNFRYYFTNLTKGQKQSTSRVSHRIGFDFSPSELANLIYKPVSEKSAVRRGSRPRGRTGTNDKKEEEEITPEEEVITEPEVLREKKEAPKEESTAKWNCCGIEIA